MEDYLLHITALRKLTWAELAPVITKVDGQVWILGTKGSKKRVDRMAIATPEQWQRACDQGLVYVEWRNDWAFAPDLDPVTNLPLLMVPYREAFERAANGQPQEQLPVQLELATASTPSTEQPAATATTPQSP